MTDSSKSADTSKTSEKSTDQNSPKMPDGVLRNEGRSVPEKDIRSVSETKSSKKSGRTITFSEESSSDSSESDDSDVSETVITSKSAIRKAQKASRKKDKKIKELKRRVKNLEEQVSYLYQAQMKQRDINNHMADILTSDSKFHRNPREHSKRR